jgi:hypothetical protein
MAVCVDETADNDVDVELEVLELKVLEVEAAPKALRNVVLSSFFGAPICCCG